MPRQQGRETWTHALPGPAQGRSLGLGRLRGSIPPLDDGEDESQGPFSGPQAQWLNSRSESKDSPAAGEPRSSARRPSGGGGSPASPLRQGTSRWRRRLGRGPQPPWSTCQALPELRLPAGPLKARAGGIASAALGLVTRRLVFHSGWSEDSKDSLPQRRLAWLRRAAKPWTRTPSTVVPLSGFDAGGPLAGRAPLHAHGGGATAPLINAERATKPEKT